MVRRPKFKFPSELRLDLISKDWVVIATGRAKRPEIFKKEKRKKEELPKEKCPFCNIETQEKPLLVFNKGKKLPAGKFPKNWSTIVIPNKYPAFLPETQWERKVVEGKPHLPPRLAPLGLVIEGGLYQTMNAIGFCELVVTKDHQNYFPQFAISQVKEVIDAYQERYLSLMKKPFVNYVSIFHNQGSQAGASQPHPHSQIITTPLIDVDLRRALLNSENHYKETKKCIYCQMNQWEMRMKKRIVFENKEFLVICPFASKAAFELIISPKSHLPFFEKITEKEKWLFAEAFKIALAKLYKGLGDPDYNFYLHTAPCDGKKYPYYHWHWTILPKTATWAGFELGARMEISTITPEKAAEYLRKQ